MKSFAIALAATCCAVAAAQAPGIRTSGGRLLMKDSLTAEVELGQVASAARRLTSVTGTMAADGAISIGRMMASDMPEVAVTIAGCDGTTYSARIGVHRTEGGVGARISSSRSDTAEAVDEEFGNFVALFAGMVDSGTAVGLRVEVDLGSLGQSCNSFVYTSSVLSVTGGFDHSFAFAGGDEVALATIADAGAVEARVSALEQDTAALLAVERSRSAGLASDLSATRSQLNAQRADLESLVADFAVVSGVVDDVTECHGRGLILAEDGTCSHAVPTCDLPDMPSGTSLRFVGEAVPGTRATIRCRTGLYDTSGGATCMRNGSWTAIQPACTACDPRCSTCTGHATCTACTDRFPNLVHGMCAGNTGLTPTSPFQTCRDAMSNGLPSGTYWLNNSAINNRARNPYQAFCMNTPHNGWTRMEGGGWEVLHVQVGGHGYTAFDGGRDTRRSNRYLRTRATNGGYGHRNVEPPQLSNPATQYSQMGSNWVERSKHNGWQWIKFMAKISTAQSTVDLRGQDTNVVSLPSNMNLDWFFNAQSRNYGRCTRMPGHVNVSVNGLPVGTTNIATITGGGGSVGLCNKRYDPCGQSSNNYINSWDLASQHTWRRIDNAITDNSIRHLFSYSDTAAGGSASRCTYCCWGCGGWKEVVMWAARPPQ